MTCRNSGLSSSVITFAKHASGLTDAQVLHLNHELMRESVLTSPTPTVRQWNGVINQIFESLESGELAIPPRSRGLIDRLNAARNETPSGARFYAAKYLLGRAIATGHAHNEYLENLARAVSLTVAEAEGIFRGEYDEARGRGFRPSPEFAARWAEENLCLPKDDPSVWAYEQIEVRRAEILQLVADEQEIADEQQHREIQSNQIETPDDSSSNTRRHYILSSFLFEIGFNQETEEIQVIMRSNPDVIYCYPSNLEEYNTFNTAEYPGRWFSQNLRGRDFHTLRVADETGRLPYRCETCGQFANLDHICQSRLPGNPFIVNNICQVCAAQTHGLEHTCPQPPAVFVFTELITGSRAFGERRMRINIPNINEIRSMATLHGVRVPVSVSYDYDGAWSHIVGQISITSTSDTGGFRIVRVNEEDNPSNLRCSCDAFVANNECEHQLELFHSIERMFATETGARSTIYTRIVDPSEMNTARRESARQRVNLARETIARVDAELALEYETSIDATRDAVRDWRGLSISMIANPEIFERLYLDAKIKESTYKQKILNGETPTIEDYPVPYNLNNAFGGVANRESGRGFGTEIEFSFPSNMTQSRVNRAIAKIGQELYEAGLTSSEEQHGYGYSHGSYTTTHNRGWNFEHDHTTGRAPGRGNANNPVYGGEIVSPVMFDEPDTWENLKKVCEILKSAGAIPSKFAGSHVHVGIGDYDHRVENHNRLLHSVRASEDLLYRLSSNPERGTHRGLDFCRPSRSADEDYVNIVNARVNNSGHHIALNLQGVRHTAERFNDRERDHVEFRTFDSSLEPAVIQTQIGVAVYMTHAALRPEEENPIVESLGTQKDQRLIATGTEVTQEKFNSSTRSIRRFMDRFVPGSETGIESDNPRIKQLAALFAITKWQSASGQAYSDGYAETDRSSAPPTLHHANNFSNALVGDRHMTVSNTGDWQAPPLSSIAGASITDENLRRLLFQRAEDAEEWLRNNQSEL